MNTWPRGQRHAMSQSDHERWNATHYPGTRQMCTLCDQPTGYCEDDECRLDHIDGPLCWGCFVAEAVKEEE